MKIYELRNGLSSQYMDFIQTRLFEGDYKEKIKAIKKRELSFKALKIKKMSDLATFGIHCGFSSSFIDLMKKKRIANFSTYPIKIVSSENCPSYYYLDINCKQIRRQTKRKKGLMDLETIYFDINDRGGEDMFTIEDTLVLLCTEKVKEITEKNKLKNFRFIEIKKSMNEDWKNHIRTRQNDQQKIQKKQS